MQSLMMFLLGRHAKQSLADQDHASPPSHSHFLHLSAMRHVLGFALVGSAKLASAAAAAAVIATAAAGAGFPVTAVAAAASAVDAAALSAAPSAVAATVPTPVAAALVAAAAALVAAVDERPWQSWLGGGMQYTLV